MKNIWSKGKTMGKKAVAEMRHFLQEESGMGSVEIILIIVVLVGLVLIFRGQVTSMVENAFSQIKSDADKVTTSNKINKGYK